MLRNSTFLLCPALSAGVGLCQQNQISMRNKLSTVTLLAFIVLLAITGCKKELLVPQAIEIAGEINTDSVWQHRENATVDYIISGSVFINAKLTIRAGTIIQLKQNASLFVDNDGMLSAIGEPGRRITITAVPGTKWGSIVFYSESDTNRLYYCDISHGGKESLVTVGAMVVVGQNSYAEGKVAIRDCVLEASAGHGLYVNDRSKVNYFYNNAFNNNAGFPVTVTTENVTDINGTATFSANGKNYVEIRDCVFPTGEGQTLTKLAVDYYIQETVTFHGYDTIQQGVVVKFSSNGALRVDDIGGITGYMNIQGTSAQPVTFEGGQGSWKGILISGGGVHNFEHTVIKDAGSTANVYGQQAGVVVESPSSYVSIRDCVFDNSGGYGIDLGGNTHYNSDIETANTFSSCAMGAVKY